MSDLLTLTNEELNAQYRAYSAEIQRRYDMARIPEQITQLATQGREMGIGESVLAEALINAPEAEVPAEAEAEAEVPAEAEAEAEVPAEAEGE